MLLCTVFLLNAAVFADLYLAVGGLASVELKHVWHGLLGLPIRFSHSLSLKLVCCLFEICNIVLGELCSCLFEVGHRHVLDLLASHHLGHLCFSLHCSFLRNFDLSDERRAVPFGFKPCSSELRSFKQYLTFLGQGERLPKQRPQLPLVC